MIALAVLALLAASLVALLFVPVRARVEFDTSAPAKRLRWRVRWLGFAFDNEAPRRPRRPRPRRERRARRGGAGGGRRVRAAIGTPGLVPRAGRLVGDLLAALSPRDVDAVIRVGLDDPASTGTFFGRLAALAAVVPQGWRVRVEPDFEEPVLEGRGSAAWSVPPARIVWPLATALASPPVWRAAWSAWRVPVRPGR